MSRLDELDKAEPLPAEDDLVLRMNAVSKVRSRKGASKKERTKPKATKSITKRRKSDTMKP